MSVSVLLFFIFLIANLEKVVSPSPKRASSFSTTKCPSELCTAVKKRDESVVREYIQSGYPYLCSCSCDRRGNKLLHLTARTESIVFANLMLEDPPGCENDVQDKKRNTPLHKAAEVCNGPMANLFLDKNGTLASLRNRSKLTPLCLAARRNSANCGGVVKDLVGKGANICQKCKGKLPYDLAVHKVTRDIFEQLGGRSVEDGGNC